MSEPLQLRDRKAMEPELGGTKVHQVFNRGKY
jgi:hypothetical protein